MATVTKKTETKTADAKSTEGKAPATKPAATKAPATQTAAAKPAVAKVLASATTHVDAKRTTIYEAMFLLTQAVAADFSGAIAHIQEILARGHAEIISMRKWDERRLAYEVKGNKRAVYILCYFKAPNEQLGHIERDCRLSEKILRSMILREESMSLEQIQATDGRKELEVEAKLRAERAAAGPNAPELPITPVATIPTESDQGEGYR
ncbi:MAG: 30S ribosomal protein S6 [Planctomycetota bacterium]